MASYTFDPEEADTVREAAEARALDVGSKLVDDQSAAREEGYQRAREQVAEEGRYAGKYKSAEDLEKAYLELQKKLGEKSAEPEEEEATEPVEGEEEASEEEEVEGDEQAVTEAFQALEQANREFYENGNALNAETIEKLSALDSKTLNNEWVNYIKSQQASQAAEVPQGAIPQAEVDRVMKSVGGLENYNQMLSWAGDNLNPQETAAYDQVMNSGNADAIYWAAQGLKARYQEEAGYEGVSYSGNRAPAAAPGFRSQAELARAISDPRYRNDPAYRLDVEEKLARSGSLL